MPRLSLFPHLFARGFNATTSALLFMLAVAGGLHAHPNGTSKVTVRLLGNDSLTVEVDANTSDMLTAVGSGTMSPEVFVPADVRNYQARAAQYAYSRLALRADNRAFLSPTVLSWKRGGAGPDDDLSRDSTAMWDTSIVLTFGGKYPAGARTLSFGAALFPEFGMQSICQASVLWRDTLVERRWLVLDRTLRVPLSPDSLEARLARNRAIPAAAAGDNLFGRFIGLGFTHILPHGLDHILFVIGLFFFSTRMRPLLFQVTAFTIAHSITLALTLLGVFALPASVVEPLIALSIVVVGIENVFFRKVKASRWLIVFAFGLIHGMGFAGVLGELGLPEGGFWPALIGFNLGVEFGQIAVIALAFGLTVWFRNKPWYFKGIVVPVSLLISAVGLYWAIERVMGG
jgi:hydrogenase/urease accessory protein HupE